MTTCQVCNGPIKAIPAGTVCGSITLRYDLWLHDVTTDQFAGRPHAPLPPAKPVKRARKAAAK